LESNELPRTDADKRHAVSLLLKDDEWAQWSDSEIGRRCKVGVHIMGFAGELKPGGLYF
jgi:hypothetical protein